MYIKMAVSTKVNLKMAEGIMVSIFVMTVTYTMVNGRKKRDLELEGLSYQMVHITKAIGKMIRLMDKESMSFQMAAYTKVNGKIKCMTD